MSAVKPSDGVDHFISSVGISPMFAVPGRVPVHLDDSIGQARGLLWVKSLDPQARGTVLTETYARASGRLGATFVIRDSGSRNRTVMRNPLDCRSE